MPIKGKSKTTKKRTFWLFTKNCFHWKKEFDWHWVRETFFFRIRGIEASNLSFSSFTTSASRRKRSDSFLENKGKSSESTPKIYSLVWRPMVWRPMEIIFDSRRKSKKDISELYWWFRNNCLFPSFSGTFRTQSHWTFITRQCCYSEQLLPACLPYWMCVQSSFYHQLWINTWRSKIRARNKQYSSCFLILWTKVTKILWWLTWVYNVMNNTCTMHGRNIKTQYIRLTSILLLRKD